MRSQPLTDLDQIAQATARLPRPLVLALDVDGTLAPIVENPAKAKVPGSTARRLRHLRSVECVELALVTGRDYPQLERMLSLPGAWRVVEHGRVLVAPGELPRRTPIEPEGRRRLCAFRAWAHEHARPRGAHIEEKEAAVGIHVRRLATADATTADAVLASAREAAREAGLFVREGRAVVEAELVPSDKGAALSKILEAAGARGVFYAGDDLTDAPALALASQRGVGVFVRSAECPTAPPGTTATVEGPEELARLLERIEARLRPTA